MMGEGEDELFFLNHRTFQPPVILDNFLIINHVNGGAFCVLYCVNLVAPILTTPL